MPAYLKRRQAEMAEDGCSACRRVELHCAHICGGLQETHPSLLLDVVMVIFVTIGMTKPTWVGVVPFASRFHPHPEFGLSTKSGRNTKRLPSEEKRIAARPVSPQPPRGPQQCGEGKRENRHSMIVHRICPPSVTDP